MACGWLKAVYFWEGEEKQERCVTRHLPYHIPEPVPLPVAKQQIADLNTAKVVAIAEHARKQLLKLKLIVSRYVKQDCKSHVRLVMM